MISIRTIDVSTDQVTVIWKIIKGRPDRLSLQYRQNKRRRRATIEDGFIILKENIMPNETTIIAAGTFDPDAEYEFRLVIYENGISVPTSGPTHSYIQTSRKYSQFEYTVSRKGVNIDHE